MGTSALPRFSAGLLLAGLLLPSAAFAAELSGEVAVEGRVFPQDALRGGFYRTNFSVMAEPELYIE